jgi:hypothetical protein
MPDGFERGFESIPALLERSGFSTTKKPRQIVFDPIYDLEQPAGATVTACYVRSASKDDLSLQLDLPISLVFIISRAGENKIFLMQLALLMPGGGEITQGHVLEQDRDYIYPPKVLPKPVAQAILKFMQAEDGTLPPNKILIDRASETFFVKNIGGAKAGFDVLLEREAQEVPKYPILSVAEEINQSPPLRERGRTALDSIPELPAESGPVSTPELVPA